MVSRDALEKVVKEDMAGIWNVLTSEEKRVVIDNFTIHNYKRNQIIYAEKETPEYLWCLLKGKVKKYKEGIGGRQQIIRLIRPGIGHIPPTSRMFRERLQWSLLLWARFQ